MVQRKLRSQTRSSRLAAALDLVPGRLIVFGVSVAVAMTVVSTGVAGAVGPTQTQSAATPATLLTAPTVPSRIGATTTTPAGVRAKTSTRKTTAASKTRKTTKTVIATVKTGVKTFLVEKTGTSGVAVRSGPAPSATLISRRAEGAVLRVVCEITGVSVTDHSANRTSSLWDKLSGGGYVAHVYTSGYDPKRSGRALGVAACPAVKTDATTSESTTTVVGAAAGAPTAPSETTTAKSGVVQVKSSVTTTV